MGDAFRVEMIVALRDVRQQLGVARCAQRTLEAQKAAVRAPPTLGFFSATHAHTRTHATPPRVLTAGCLASTRVPVCLCAGGGVCGVVERRE